MNQYSSPSITCPHCQGKIIISIEVLLNGHSAPCSGCGATLKLKQGVNEQAMQELGELMTKINQIKS